MRIGIASLCGTGQHVGYARDYVRRFWFVSFGVTKPLHRSRIGAHGRFADNVWVPRHAREAIAAFAQNHLIALRVGIDDACGLRNVFWSCRDGSIYLSSAVSMPAFAIPLSDVFDSARLSNLIPIIKSRAMVGMALANTFLESSDLICVLL